ncbi:MAG: bile acid:sodium symporter family protein [Planctomycetaceae bacterium]
MLQRHLLLWLVLSSAIALFWPAIMGQSRDQASESSESEITFPFDPFLVPSAETGRPQPRFPLGTVVAITMFAIGTLLPPDEISMVLQRWPTVLGGTIVQYTSMPLLAFGLATIFQLPRDLFVGVVLVGCVPGAMASNVLTLAARGNISYSVSLTTLATLLSPIVVPLALQLALRTRASIDSLAISMQLLREVVGPVIAGYVICRVWKSGGGVLRKIAGPVANLAILWIIATVVALNRDRLQQISMAVLSVLLLLNVGGYLAGYWGATAMRLSHDMRKALTIEVGMQNAGVGTALALKWFSDTPTAAIPTAAYTFGCMLTGTMLAKWFARSILVEQQKRVVTDQDDQ